MATPLVTTFNGVDFASFGFNVRKVEFNYEHNSKSGKSAIADRGISSEATMGPLRIRLTGELSAADNNTARDNWGLILKNCRGTDRVKKGRLQVHSDSHYFCQLVGATPVPILGGEGHVSVSLEFLSEEPYRRTNAITTYAEVLSISDPFMVLAYPATISGDAWRIPFVLKPSAALAWTAGQIIRIQNATVGWRFEHVITQNLSAGQLVVIDGETSEVYENGNLVGEGNSGGGLYLRGGVANTLYLGGTTSSKLSGSWSVEFWDRFVG